MAAGSRTRRNCSPPKATRSPSRSCRLVDKTCCRRPFRLNNSDRGEGRTMDQATTVSGDKPLWRKIVDFPLVAMLIALAAVIACIALATFLMRSVVPAVPGLTRSLEFDLVTIPLLIIAYELLIRRLGEHPRDDYRDPKALRNLGLGLVAGFLIFSVAVAIAAVMGVYRITGEG